MMKLFKIALSDKKIKKSLVFSIFLMILLTFASQLEIVALGILTQKGPDFFELFSPIKEGRLQKIEEIHWQDMENRWQKLAISDKNVVTKQDVNDFFVQFKKKDLLETVIYHVNQMIPISSNMVVLAFFLVFVALFKAITLFSYRFLSKCIAIAISKNLRQSYFDHLQKLPMNFYQSHHVGGLSSRVVGDAAWIAEAVNACLVNYLQTPFVVISTLILCFLTSWQLSLIIFFGFPLIVFPIIFLAKRMKRISLQLQKNQEVFAAVLIDFLAGVQTIKVFGREEFSLKKYQEQNEKMAHLEVKGARYDLSSRPIIHMIGMFFLATALLYGLYVQKMSVAEVLVYCGFLYVFYEPIKKIAEENSRIQRGIAAAERMQEVLETKPNILDKDGAEELLAIEQIEFDHVWFRYQSEWVLKDVSFTINAGQTVAIVGPTGGGKSTIAQLIPRLFEVEKGQIRINGKSIDSYTQRSLRENMAFVPQKPFLFLDTIQENISFGCPFSEAQIEKAAKLAHAEEFILQLPKKYQTELKEAGKNLSGGQQQRLAIARALVKNSSLLILDEATSSLDAISENYIKETLLELDATVTKILIAHRLSTIENADKIIYLEKGEKVVEGTKNELLLTCPKFKQMWDFMYLTNSKRETSEKSLSESDEI